MSLSEEIGTAAPQGKGPLDQPAQAFLLLGHDQPAQPPGRMAREQRRPLD